MVGSQGTSQFYGQQIPDDSDAVLLAQIPTNDLMVIDGMFSQELLKEDMEQCEQLVLPPATPMYMLDHMNKTPTLEEYHEPAFDFQVDLNGESSSKSSWMFSSPLNKVYVKMGQTCTFNVSYQSLNYQDLFVRAMLVCSSPEDMHHPVFRCENHRRSDNTIPKLPEELQTHVMRCYNPSAQYVGVESGIAYKDRLAILIPLASSTVDHTSLSVSLGFVCQNSCRIINRRPTAIVFTLEDINGRILGRKALHLKVCSCPKRDKQKEEQGLVPTKRKSSDALQVAPETKVAKTSSAHRHPSGSKQILLEKLASIKKERSPESSPTGRKHHHRRHHTRRARSLTPYSSQELVDQTATTISVPMPSVQAAVKVAEYAFQVVAGELVRCGGEDERKNLAAYLTQIRRLQKTLKGGHTASSSDSSSDSD
ncbi:cellular tumor antigen p53-like isoform X2 [Sabethes cyaneus]|uniref:cellular tumor antigen p53-like isoform X2 n=1 Tax=Sabethes cyaneus TaxID=53552 RepID=UPI00237D62C7|nr:cellular tumor antigen p53-like isoform X2 [Sabethes cyaneus]